MSDPMDKPPVDHGSDRWGYVEVSPGDYGKEFPESWELVDWVLRIMDEPCPDCNANVFFKYQGPPDGDLTDRENFYVTVAHDDGCPVYLAHENDTP